MDNINFPDSQRNGSQAYHRQVKATYAMHNRRTEIKKINSVSESTTPVNLFPDQITDFADIGTTIRTATITDAVTEVTKRRSRDK